MKEQRSLNITKSIVGILSLSLFLTPSLSSAAAPKTMRLGHLTSADSARSRASSKGHRFKEDISIFASKKGDLTIWIDFSGVTGLKQLSLNCGADLLRKFILVRGWDCGTRCC